jgi:hypothetical protein
MIVMFFVIERPVTALFTVIFYVAFPRRHRVFRLRPFLAWYRLLMAR